MSKGGISDGEVKSALNRVIEWMYGGTSTDNVGNAADTGARIASKNQGAGGRVWALPGCFNTSSRVSRTLHVPAGTALVCVVADSYASELEKDAQAAGNQHMAADNIDGLVQDDWAKFDGNPVTVDKIGFNYALTIGAGNPIISRYSALGYQNKRYDLSARIRYALVDSDRITPGRHTIEVHATSPDKPAWKEPEWTNHVLYTIDVP